MTVYNNSLNLNKSNLPVTSINVQRITSTGTYTPSSSLILFAIVEVQGGGASGYGASTGGYCGGGGGAGGYAKSILTAAQLLPNVSVTIGAGGTGNSGAGNAGGTTYFGASGSPLLYATGGSTGTGNTQTTTRGYNFGGGIGGVGNLGNMYNLAGNSGGYCVYISAALNSSGTGGGGLYGRGAGLGKIQGNAGGAATANTGAGGGGAASSTGSQNGGNGGSGVIIVTEFLGSLGTTGKNTIINNYNYNNQINGIAGRTFTSSGTYTPTSGMKFCIIDCHGGGGAGASVSTTISNLTSIGSGGGSGGWARGLYTSTQIGASQAVTIGTGTNSVGSLISATAGSAGTATSTANNNNYLSVGGAGGTATNGNIFNLPGMQGGLATCCLVGAYVGNGGCGGQGYMGRGAGYNGNPVSSNGVAGINAVANSGAGGSGGYVLQASSTSKTGGTGAAGIVTILEFLST